MYSNFILSVNAVLPMAVLMLIGMLIKHRNWLNQAELKRLNGVIFKVFFFFMLFNSTYHATINDYRPRLLLYGIVAVLLLWIAEDGVDRSEGSIAAGSYRVEHTHDEAVDRGGLTYVEGHHQ